MSWGADAQKGISKGIIFPSTYDVSIAVASKVGLNAFCAPQAIFLTAARLFLNYFAVSFSSFSSFSSIRILLFVEIR